MHCGKSDWGLVEASEVWMKDEAEDGVACYCNRIRVTDMRVPMFRYGTKTKPTYLLLLSDVQLAYIIAQGEGQQLLYCSNFRHLHFSDPRATTTTPHRTALICGDLFRFLTL